LGGSFLWGSYLKISEVAQNSWATFFRGTSYALILTKLGLGHIFGDFSINSPGHPGSRYFFLCNLIRLFFVIK
jgi:hypothetical protein